MKTSDKVRRLAPGNWTSAHDTILAEVEALEARLAFCAEMEQKSAEIIKRWEAEFETQEARLEAYECLQKESAGAFKRLEARCAAQEVRLDVVHTTRPLGTVIREATAPFEAKIQTLETECGQWKQKYQTELELCLQVHEDRDQWKADYYKTAAAYREYAHTETETEIELMAELAEVRAAREDSENEWFRDGKIEAYEDCGRICEKHGIDSVAEIWEEIDARAEALKAEGGK